LPAVLGSKACGRDSLREIDRSSIGSAPLPQASAESVGGSFEKLLFIVSSPLLLTSYEIVHYKTPNHPYNNRITDVCGDAS